MNIEQYDEVLLKDGRIGCVVEVRDNRVFYVDVGSSPEDWETIFIEKDDIEKIVSKQKR